MYQAKVKRGHDVIATINVPESLDEVRLNRYIDFLYELKKGIDTDVNNIAVIARAVGYFYDVDINTLIGGDMGDFTRAATKAEIKSLNATLANLYGWAADLVRRKGEHEYTGPDDYEFEYKGERLKIHGIKRDAIGGALLPPLSVIEGIEISEVHRITKSRIDTLGDSDGSELYGMYLRSLAILCRKEGEQLPIDDGAREYFINERAAWFSEITAGAALMIDFFLTSSSGSYDQSRPAVGSLSLLSFALLVEMSQRSMKHTNERSAEMKKHSKRLDTGT